MLLFCHGWQLHKYHWFDTWNSSQSSLLCFCSHSSTNLNDSTLQNQAGSHFTCVRRDSCMNLNDRTPRPQAEAPCYFWLERQLHKCDRLDAPNSSGSLIVLLSGGALTQIWTICCSEYKRHTNLCSDGRDSSSNSNDLLPRTQATYKFAFGWERQFLEFDKLDAQSLSETQMYVLCETTVSRKRPCGRPPGTTDV